MPSVAGWSTQKASQLQSFGEMIVRGQGRDCCGGENDRPQLTNFAMQMQGRAPGMAFDGYGDSNGYGYAPALEQLPGIRGPKPTPGLFDCCSERQEEPLWLPPVIFPPETRKVLEMEVTPAIGENQTRDGSLNKQRQGSPSPARPPSSTANPYEKRAEEITGPEVGLHAIGCQCFSCAGRHPEMVMTGHGTSLHPEMNGQQPPNGQQSTNGQQPGMPMPTQGFNPRMAGGYGQQPTNGQQPVMPMPTQAFIPAGASYLPPIYGGWVQMPGSPVPGYR